VPLASNDVIKNKTRTTDPTIALGNLDSQIAQTTGLLASHPKNPDLYGKTVSLLLQRSGVTGSAKDRARALEIAEAYLADHPEEEKAHSIHAHALAAMHRFDEALAEVDVSEKLTKVPGSNAELRFDILAALGRYDEVYGPEKQLAEKYPSPSTLLTYATTAGHMGKTEEAEAAFVKAEELFHGATPFLLATIYYERASLWERLGDLPKATLLYRAAIERLPQHAHAAVHLAALLSPSEGVALLEPLTRGDDVDPDALGELSVLQSLVKEKSGEEMLARARARYDLLMTEQPTAYADHAGWFWLVAGGDPKKAEAAAKKNLEVRKTAEAYELSIAAEQAISDKDALCAVAADARALQYRSPKLDEALRTIKDCPAVAPGASASAAASVSASPSSAASVSAAASAPSSTPAKP